MTTQSFFIKNRIVLLYGLFMALLVFMLKWFQYTFVIADTQTDIYSGIIALFFMALGIWTALQLRKPMDRTVVIEKEIFIPLPEPSGINTNELEKLNLTGREQEVLQLLVQGYSNTEIAERLFLSLSTIKTHVSNLYVKMDVTSRAKAIEKARRLKIIL